MARHKGTLSYTVFALGFTLFFGYFVVPCNFAKAMFARLQLSAGVELSKHRKIHARCNCWYNPVYTSQFFLVKNPGILTKKTSKFLEFLRQKKKLADIEAWAVATHFSVLVFSSFEVSEQSSFQFKTKKRQHSRSHPLERFFFSSYFIFSPLAIFSDACCHQARYY